MSSLAEIRIRQGCDRPYDRGEGGTPYVGNDPMRRAVLGILADLGDRRGIKRELEGVEDDVRSELVESLTEIVRVAFAVETECIVDQTDIKPEAVDDGWEWAIVEVMGHRRHAGRTREVERLGVKMVRVDVPTKGDPATHGWTSHFYPGSALFSFTPAEEAACLAANKPYERPSRLALPQRDADDDSDIPW